MATSSNLPSVTLPPGVSIGPGRETSRTVQGGGVQQGLEFTLTLPDNTSTSVFVPYSTISNTDAVQAVFEQRIAAIRAITGQ